MKERTKEELECFVKVVNNPDRLYGHEFVHEIIDQLIAETEKPKVWDGAPDWATEAWIEWRDERSREIRGKCREEPYTRTLPKTRADELAEEAAREIESDESMVPITASVIRAAILRREKEMEEGR